jgi:putative glutamine amidotransferase
MATRSPKSLDARQLVAPRILLPGKLTSGATGVRGDSYSNGLKYAQAIARAGGVAMTVPPLGEFVQHVADLVGAADGVLIQGGGDIAPERYGESRRSDTVYGIVHEHDEFEIAVAREAVKQNKPLLAICRGLQVLNVALGGTLHQDTYHPIVVTEGSRLATALGTLTPEHSHSYHHQALKEVASELVVVARAPDNVIEAVEHRSCKFIVGVQWHPEDDADNTDCQQQLFVNFVSRCKSR